MSLTIPEIPANPTPEQAAALSLKFAQLGLIIANTGNGLIQDAELSAVVRHSQAQAAAQARHEAANGPLGLGDFAAALAARAPLDVTVEQLDAVTRARWVWLQSLDAPAPEPAEPPAPEPEPEPEPAPPPAPVEPPAELTDDQAAWYLDQLRNEFARYNVPTTVEFAREHWVKWGRPQGRKWAADAPPPAWGPRAEEAPAGLLL